MCAAAETASEPDAFEIPDVFLGDAFVEPFSLPPERRRSRGMLHRSARIRDDSGGHGGTRLVRSYLHNPCMACEAMLLMHAPRACIMPQ